MKVTNFAAYLAVSGVMAMGTANAADFNLRMQTQYAAETVSGRLAQGFIDNVEAMSGGRVEIEMFWSSAVVATVEGFDAAASGILDGEMHGGAYQTGKNPAFQFVGDPMGGYDDPYELYSFTILAVEKKRQMNCMKPLTCTLSVGGQAAKSPFLLRAHSQGLRI